MSLPQAPFSKGDRVEYYTNSHSGSARFGTVQHTTGDGRWAFVVILEDDNKTLVNVPAVRVSR